VICFTFLICREVLTKNKITGSTSKGPNLYSLIFIMWLVKITILRKWWDWLFLKCNHVKNFCIGFKELSLIWQSKETMFLFLFSRAHAIFPCPQLLPHRTITLGFLRYYVFTSSKQLLMAPVTFTVKLLAGSITVSPFRAS
jgi:hypothetical protein